MVGYAIKLSGVNGVALTKLDVLDTFAKIKICIGYKLNGKTINYVPETSTQLEKLQPIYKTMQGWNTPTQKCGSYRKLPANAKKYIKEIEKLIDCPVTLISTSPDRKDTILIKDPFK